MKTTQSSPTMKLPLQRIGETLKAPCNRRESLSHPALQKNSIFHSILPQRLAQLRELWSWLHIALVSHRSLTPSLRISKWRTKSDCMAPARRSTMATMRIVTSSKSSETTITRIRSLLPFKDLCFTRVCNTQARDQMRNRRPHKGHRLCTGYGWKFGLRTCMIAALRLCQFLTLAHPNPSGMLTDQGLIAGDRGEKGVSDNFVDNSAAGLKDEFVADLPIKLGYLIFLMIAMSICLISCVDVIIGREILFHPYC